MDAQLLEGKKIAEKLRLEIAQQVGAHKKKFGVIPVLRAIQVG